MARPGVTEAQVFEAIASLQDLGIKVTIENIRAELGQGSPNTINRHVRTWRAKPPVHFNPQTQNQIRQLKKQCAAFEAELEMQANQAQTLSNIIFDRDQQLLALAKKLQEKEQALQETRQSLDKMEGIQEAILTERQALIQSQRTLAEQLRDDLKAINEMSLSQVRDISMGAQDQWMEEKLKVRILSGELEHLKVLNKTLEQKIQAEQHLNVPLRKKITEQENLIAQCLDPTKVEVFFKVQGEGNG